MRKSLSLSVVFSLLIVATAALAGNKADTFSVSPVVGGISYQGYQHLETSPVFGARAGYNFTKEIGVELLFDWTRTEGTLAKRGTTDIYRYGGEALYHFIPDEKFVPYFAVGYAAINFVGDTQFPKNEKTKGAIDYGPGFKYFVTEDVAWRADFRHLIYFYKNNDQSAFEYTTGVYIPFGGTPQVARLADPPPPPPAEPAPVAKPAPLPPAAPAAPTTTLTASPTSVMKGETSTLTWTSQNATSCEILPVVGAVQTQGNTPVTPENNTIYTLTCKGEGGVSKSKATVSVTSPPPPKPSAAAERFCNKPAILMINFDVDKYNIKPQYHDELKTVGDFLKEFPNSHGEIGGHTDNTYTKAYNQKLSERRANSVKEYIIKNFGIAPERITSKGYNFSKPIDTNKTAAGRAKNRRIEANFVCE